VTPARSLGATLIPPLAFALGLLTTGGSCVESLTGLGTLPLKLVGGGLVVAVAAALRQSRPQRPWPPSYLPLGVLFLLCVVSLGWSQDLSSSLRASRHLLLEVGLFVALALSPARLILLRAVALGGALGGLVLAVAMLGAFVFGSADSGRLGLWGVDPNLHARELALGLVFSLVFVLPMIRSEAQGKSSEARTRGASLKQGMGWGLGLLILGVGLGLTASRGTMVAVGVSLLPCGVMAARGRASLRTPLLAGGLVLLLFATSLGFVATDFRDDLRSPWAGFEDADREAVTSGRDAIWANVWSVIKDHPLHGVGLAAVPSVYDTYREDRMAAGGLRSKPERDPHSFYLQLLAGLGPAGLVLFLSAVFLAVQHSRRSVLQLESQLVLAFALSSALSQSTLELNDFWLALAWACLASALPRQESAS